MGGVLFPLLAGPVRVVAYIFWTMGADAENPEDEMLQAWLFLEYGITSFDSFNGYFMDYVVYGFLYPMVGLDVGFQEISFEDITETIYCYNLNGYGTTGGGIPTR